MGIRVIHADSSLQYYGYYLAGFESIFGAVPLSFGTHDLPRLAAPQEGLAVELVDGRRIFVSAADRAAINEEALEWCDAYGMVNLDPRSRLLVGGHKLVPLGPGFGIRWGSRVERSIRAPRGARRRAHVRQPRLAVVGRRAGTGASGSR